MQVCGVPTKAVLKYTNLCLLYTSVPSRAPKGKVAQLMIFGANVISVQGTYEETFRLSAEAIDRWGWYNSCLLYTSRCV